MSNNWKSCDNCADVFCPFTEDEACESWLTIECPRCGGPLSELYVKPKRKLCESCIYLESKSKGTFWKYYCDMHDGFDRCPEYCRDYRERAAKEE